MLVNCKTFCSFDCVSLRGMIAAVGVSLAVCLSALGELWLFVDASSPGGDGLSSENALPHLQDALAIAAVNPNVTEIRVAQGLYTPDPGETDRHATFMLVSGVTVRGGYAGLAGESPNAWDPELYETVLSGDLLGNDGPDFENYGDNSYTVVTAIGTEVTLQPFAVAGDGRGGSWPVAA